MNERDPQRRSHRKSSYMLVTYGILLYMALQHFSSVKSVFAWFFSILRPVAYGICIAFVINLFLNLFRNKVFSGMSASTRKWEQKAAPILSAVCTALVAAIILAMVVILIIPQIMTAVNTLVEKMPNSQGQLYALVYGKFAAWHAPDFLLKKLKEFNGTINWETALKFISNMLDGKAETVLGKAFNATTSVVSTAGSLLLGLILALYLLAQKTRVLHVTHKVIQLFTPQRYQEQVFRILRLANDSFASYLTGQFCEAVIIGTLCTIGLYIFGFPYAATIGVLTGITALIPIIGAWIGGGFGALLIWVEAPERTIWFLVFILVLQQLEGKLIYPKVVGNSVGLPGLLVLIAVIVGAGLGGITGIIFAVPIFAILYQLLKDAINKLPDDTETAAAEPEPEPACTEETAVLPEEPAVPEPITVPATPPASPARQQPRRKRRKRH